MTNLGWRYVLIDEKLTDGGGNRLERVREKLRAEGLDAYIFYAKDPHQSEYVADFWNDRKWLTGFEGSAGTLVVTSDAAGLWTDGRYAVEACEQIGGTEVGVYVVGTPATKKMSEFLKDKLKRGARVGVNGRVLSLKAYRNLKASLDDAGIEIVSDIDVLEGLWTERPDLPSQQIRLYPLEYAGLSRAEKIDQLREKMRERGIGCYAVCALDAVAWLFNIRGCDIKFCPTAYAFAIVSHEGAALFVEASKVPPEVRAELESDGVALKPYDAFVSELAKTSADEYLARISHRIPAASTDSTATAPQIGQAADCSMSIQPHRRLPDLRPTDSTLTALATKSDEKSGLGYDPSILSKEFYDALPESSTQVELKCLVGELKCIKNQVEITNLETVLERDGVAFCRFLFWLENSMNDGCVSELDAAEKIAFFRREQEGMVDLSFASISGYGAHAALPHYRVSQKSNSELRPSGLFLLDSGGQYLGGTTDLTRTIALGDLTEEMRRDYTLVLKGLINMSRAVFISGSTGANLDILARTAMWERGMDYKHGTGHGVGSFLNVHEGPCGLSLKSTTSLRPGMVLTIEPGIYREGSHGVRIENMVIVEEAMQTEMGSFLRFKTVTLAPIDIRPIQKELLAESEIEWLNTYHQNVDARLGERMGSSESARLQELTNEI